MKTQNYETWNSVVNSDGDEREERIRQLMAGMSLKEKVRQMSGNAGILDLPVMLVRYNLYPFRAGADKRLGIPPIRFTDGPRGVALNHSTCFPVSMARGATWDVGLERRVGDAMGIEARAQGADFFGGVCINLVRHPGWGRAQESFGEDPHLLGAMGVAMVSGLQNHVMACAKHFACNSIEESRFFVDVRVDERTLREVYLPHFKRCVDAGAAAIMSAYNRVNGEYCAHNSHLLRDILKGDWAFDGMVISDFVFGTRSTVKAARGGLDIEMPNTLYYGRRLVRAVRRGRVPEAAVDEAVTRILRQKARFAGVGDVSQYKRDKVAGAEHRELALEVARKSIVLLRNENRVLPLARDGVRHIAVFGALADMANLGDRGSSQVRPPDAVTPLAGIRQRAGDSVEVSYERGDDLTRAAKAAQEADVAIVVVGLTGRDEGEAMPVVKIGGDREDLALRRSSIALIEAVAEAAPKCVVVLEGGSAVLVSGWRDKVDAILMAWYPGMEGGTAIAEVLFGDVNPGGKLPLTFPLSNEQLPFFDKRAKTVEYGYYHGYRLFDRQDLEPAYPFGFGLSYTEFRYDGLELAQREIASDGILTASVKVINTGSMAGEEIVQVYIGFGNSSVERAPKELKAFARVHLEPGESRTVGFTVAAADLAYWDEPSGWKVEEMEYEVLVGSSSRDVHLRDSFRIAE